MWDGPYFRQGSSRMRSVPSPGKESDPHTGVFRGSFWPVRSLAAAGSCSPQQPSTYTDCSYECRGIPPPMRVPPLGCTPHSSHPSPDKFLWQDLSRMLPPECIPRASATTNHRGCSVFLPCSHTDPCHHWESPSHCSSPARALPSPPIRRCSRRLSPPSSCHRRLPAASFGASSLAHPPLLDPCPLHGSPSRQPSPSFLECCRSYGRF